MSKVSDAEWLEEAARYFENRSTGGEDMAFWANVSNAERCRSIAQSLRSQPAGVRVKGLEWGERKSNGDIYADSVVGEYGVGDVHGKHTVMLRVGEQDSRVAQASGFDDAKAAAQADYERRILSALSTSAEQVERKPEPEDAIHELYLDALAEADKAMRKFPQPNYVISKVAEEAGEVVKAAIHCAEGRDTHQNLVGEIRQAMAMLIRLYIEGDQVHGLSSPRAALEGSQSNER